MEILSLQYLVPRRPRYREPSIQETDKEIFN